MASTLSCKTPRLNNLVLTTFTVLNARMRRIDLVCKLAGPLFIALINGASTRIAVFVLLSINASSLPVEYFTIAQLPHRPRTHTLRFIRALSHMDSASSHATYWTSEGRDVVSLMADGVVRRGFVVLLERAQNCCESIRINSSNNTE
ncbi:MAG: hypothetical protein Q9214_005307 [Letrouitia sp. 1 TL-2023]